MNYMNVLSDFEIRLNSVCPVNVHDEEVNRLSADIKKRDHMILELQDKLAKLEKKPVIRKKAGTAAVKGRTAAPRAATKATQKAAPKAASKAAPGAAVKAVPKAAPGSAAKKVTTKKTAAKGKTAAGKKVARKTVSARKKSGSK